MSGGTRRGAPARSGRLRRLVALLSAATLVGSTAALFVPSVANAVVPPAATWGGYGIDGTVPDATPGRVDFSDPSGAGKELGPVGGLKISELHQPRTNTLTDAATSDKSDLESVWLDVQDAGGVAWLYLAWERVSKNGSVIVMYEFQKGGQPAGCSYPSPASTCNPWRNRVAGDFVIVFDYQGGGVSKIWKRDFVPSGGGLALNTGVLLNDAVVGGTPAGRATTSPDELRGEAAVNLTATVFPPVPTSCSSFATLVPYTVTGNSDTAAPEDVVLADTSKAAISNCGKVSIAKETTPTTGVAQDFSVTLSRTSGAAVGYPGGTPNPATINASQTATTVSGLRPADDYTLTEADVDGWEKVSITCGEVVVWEKGKATGKTFSVRVDGTTSCFVVNKQTIRDIEVVKGATVASGATPPLGAGTVVTYTMDVTTGSGNVPLTAVRVEDALCSGGNAGYVSGDVGNRSVLDLGETWRYSCDYVVTQADVDAGTRTNTAKAYGTHGTVEVEDDDTHQFATLQTDTVAVTKTPSAPAATGGFVLGEVVTYTLTLKNTGTVTLTSPTMADPLCSAKPTLTAKSANQDDLLDPGETWTWTCTYGITQADVDRGEVDNTATGSGTFAGALVSAEAEASVTTLQDPELGVTKSAAPSTGLTAGDAVLYTVTVSNSGNVTLTGVTAQDPLCTLAPAPPGQLAVGETWTSTCTYVVTQADVDAAPTKRNTVTATGTPPSGAQLVQTASADIAFDRTPKLEVDKAATPDTGVKAGDRVAYSVTVKNPGPVTLTDVAVADPLCPGGAATWNGANTGSAGLDVGETWTFTCTYVVTQADVDAGSIVNVATGSARFDQTSVSDTGIKTVLAAQGPSLAVDKQAGPPVDGLEAGDVVPYSVTVDNDGDVTLTDVVVSDPLCTLTRTGGDDGDGTLQVDETWTYGCSYTVKQSDVDAGSIVNVATGSAVFAGRTYTDTGTATVRTRQVPGIAVDKTAAPATGLRLSDQVLYTITVRNAGDVTLTDVAVADPLCTPVLRSGDDGDGKLQVSEVWTWTCSYGITQADVDRGSVDNTATGSASFGATPVVDTGTARVTTLQQPALVVDKTASPATGLVLGSPVLYTVTVSNGGNVTLSDVTLADPLCTPVLQRGDSNGDGKLQVGEVWTSTCTYAVVQADVDRGSVSNTATGRAVFGTTPVTDTGTAVVQVVQSPSLALVKTPTVTSFSAVGDVLRYRYEVTNSGTTTLIGPFTVRDDKTSVSCPATAQLAPSASLTCTAEHLVTQADVDTGSVTNVATATNGTVTSPPATARVVGVRVLAEPPAVAPAAPVPSVTMATPLATPLTAPAPTQPRQLPFTGAWLLPMLSVGSATLLLGALLTGAARSRREDGAQ